MKCHLLCAAVLALVVPTQGQVLIKKEERPLSGPWVLPSPL